MSINEKDMSFFFFYKRRASFYQGNLNFVTTNGSGITELAARADDECVKPHQVMSVASAQ
jgi:hypothetical protein